MKCPKCEGEMEKGIMLAEPTSNMVKARFPVKRWASKITAAFFKWSGSKVENEKDIENYRCKKCGYLENYAK